MNSPSTSTFDNREEMAAGLQPPGAPSPGGMYPAAYKFSPDELKVLGECNRESFFQRSLPLGSAMGFATYIAIQKDYLKPNLRFGVLPKVTLAVVTGYFIGKLSYQQICAEKLMALPGSYIGQLLRERKEGKVRGTSVAKPPATMFGASPNDIYSDAGPGSALDLDTDRPLFNDDSFRPGSEPPPGAGPSEAKPSTRSALSYDELRRRNRGEYHDTKQDPYRLEPNTVPPIPVRPPPTQPETKPSTNKYGDVME